MENDAMKKSAKRDEDVIENIAGFVYMNSTEKTSYDDVFAQIEEAYTLLKQDLKKEMVLIVSAMLEANMDPGLISNMEKEVYSESRKNFFNQVLYAGVEDIDKIRGSVQESTLKPFGVMFDDNGEVKRNIKSREANEILERVFFDDIGDKDFDKSKTGDDDRLLDEFDNFMSIYNKYKQSSYKIDIKVMKEIDENDKRTQEFFKINNIDYTSVIKAANNNDLESAKKVQVWQRSVISLNDTRSYEELGTTEKIELFRTIRYLSLIGDEDSKKIQEELIKRKMPPKIQKEIYERDENGNQVINENYLKARMVKGDGEIISDEKLMEKLEIEAKCYMEMPECHFEDAEAAFEDANIESKKLKLAEYMKDAFQSASLIVDEVTTDGKKLSLYETQAQYMDLKLEEFKKMAMENPDAALFFAREALDFEGMPLDTKVDPLYRKYMSGVAQVTMDVLDAAKKGEISLVEDKYTLGAKTQIFSNLAQSMIDVNEVDVNLLRRMIMLDSDAANRAAQELGINTLLDVKANPDKPNLAKKAREEAMKPLTNEKREEINLKRTSVVSGLIYDIVADSYLRNEFDEYQEDMLAYYNSLESKSDKKIAAEFIVDRYFLQGNKGNDENSRETRKQLFGELLKHGNLAQSQMELLIKCDKSIILELMPELSKDYQYISMKLGVALQVCSLKEKRCPSYINFMKANKEWNNEQRKFIAENYFSDNPDFMEQCEHNKLVFEGESLKYSFQIKNDYDKLSTFFKEEKASYPIIDMFNLKQDEDRDDR